jgi:hypothetical protein
MRRIWILDIALFGLLAAAAVRFHNEWIMFNATHQPGAVEPEREKFAKVPFNIPPNSPAPANWTDIPSHNPFSFDRTDIAILEPKAPPPPPPPKVTLGPKPVLFGTMSIGTDLLAMVGKGTGQGKPASHDHKPMKIGEVIDGWKIVSISVENKSMVVSGNDVQETIIMNDPMAQIPREHTRTVDVAATPAPNVVSVGPPPPAPAVSQSQPAAQGQQAPSQPGTTRKVKRITPFGIIEVDEP